MLRNASFSRLLTLLLYTNVFSRSLSSIGMCK